MRKKAGLFTGLGLSLVVAAVAVTAAFAAGTPSTKISTGGVVPTAYPGNFVASDNTQVCYELVAQGLLANPDAATGDLVGLKIDPPANYSDGYVTVTISPDGKELSWSIENGTMIGIIVKGGSTFNVYDYTVAPGLGLTSDSGLTSPPNGTKKGVLQYPQISHYNICYVKNAVEDGNGCTPGYWRNHADRWLGVAPSDDFDLTFGVDLFNPDITLGQAVSLPQTYGTFAFHAVAALLNSYGGVPNGDGGTVNYPYDTADVIAAVQAAVAAGETQGPIQALADANELGCPLSGTRAVPV